MCLMSLWMMLHSIRVILARKYPGTHERFAIESLATDKGTLKT